MSGILMKYLLIVAFAGVLAFSCQSSNKAKREGNGGAVDQNSQLYWVGYFQSWFQNNCADCHRSDGDEPDLSSYEKVKYQSRALLDLATNRTRHWTPIQISQNEWLHLERWVMQEMPFSNSAGRQDSSPEWNRSDSLADRGTRVSYLRDVQPLLRNRCLSCHSENGEFPDLTTYRQVRTNAQNILRSVENNSMPRSGSPLSQVDKDVLRRWIAAGMPESTQSDSFDSSGEFNNQGINGAVVSYSQEIRGWISQNCGLCHVTGNNRPYLGNYQEVKQNARSIIDSLRSGRMPKGRRMQSFEYRRFEEWISGGFQQ